MVFNAARISLLEDGDSLRRTAFRFVAESSRNEREP